MSPRPEEYLERAVSIQSDLILESNWHRLLRPARKPTAARTRTVRNYVAARLHWLADRLQTEPDLLATAG